MAARDPIENTSRRVTRPLAERFDRRHASLPADQRTPSQRDRDRILYSTAFRRLGGVTQVAPAHEGHSFHNRLTHTLKVGQLGRRLAEHLIRCGPEGGQGASSSPEEVIDPEVVEAACYAHDLGHPPFGHIGEETLDMFISKTADQHGLVLDGFEGNAQSFRIVTKLALRDPRYPGLDLTRATLNAILKYPWLRGEHGKKMNKWGAYVSEEQDFLFARELGPVIDMPCVEAQIMDWADDITYAVHDAEDLYKAGLVPLDRLRTSDDERQRFVEWVSRRWASQDRSSPRDEQALHESLSDAIMLFPITEPYEGTRRHRREVRAYGAQLIGMFVQQGTCLQVEDGQYILSIREWARLQVDLFQELTWHYVIERPSLATMQHGQRRLLNELLTMFQKAVWESDTSILPVRFKEELTALPTAGYESEEAARLRVVGDMVASMTEEEATTIHRRLTGMTPGTVLAPPY